MIMRRFDRRQARDALPDALLAGAASLQDERSVDDILDRLTRDLADRNVTYVLLGDSGGNASFEVLRSTLPLSPEVWGRRLRLARLAPVLARSRPLFDNDVASAFAESGEANEQRTILTSRTTGMLIAAPLRLSADRNGVLCLVSRNLTEHDQSAVWGLALQLGAALQRAEAEAARSAPTAAPAANGSAADDLPLFHELTRRLSYSLSCDEVLDAALEVVAPAIDMSLAAAVLCRDGSDSVTIYATGKLDSSRAGAVADGVLHAFLRLTGGKHRSCARPALRTATLPGPAEAAIDPDPRSLLDAPLVIEGEIIGLLRIAAGSPATFEGNKKRAFYTVANQVSLALERVTAQQRAERAHLASLSESLSDGIILVDASLRVTSLNSAARNHVAALEGASLGDDANLAGTPLGKLAQAVLSSGKQTALEEVPTASTSAGRRYLVAMAAPLAGSPEGSSAVVILRDVTEERLMQERLVQSEKMVSVGQLVSGVAHELNNPLTGVMGFAQLLMARDLDERTLHDIETIYSEAERAAKIVQNLLSFARRRRAEKELANLNVVLERVLELRSYELRLKSIEVVLDLGDDVPETMVDADQIQQVFLNVIVNAEQAMQSNEGESTLTVRTRREGDTIRVSFQDEGPGMDTDTQRRIFDPFFTTKEAGEGTGLGLTISYGIIDEHGGRIWAESAPRRGTTFFIELPIVRGGSRRSAREEEEPAAAVEGQSILVVDDEESIQRLLGSILQMDGHRVDTARNGREALELIERRPYDVVITDIKMPDMDGRDLYRRLLEVDRGLAQRTIFITGDTVSPDTREFLQQVRNLCLAKPFRVREVRDTIIQILSERT